jgi:hypothetical protein
MSLRSLRAPLAALALLAVSACQPSIPPYTVHVPARLDTIRPPRSVAFVRDDVPLEGLRGAIERAVPADVDGRKKTGIAGLREVELTWKLDRKPVVLRADASGLVMEIVLAGKVGAHGDGVRCHADDAKIVFRTETAPALRSGGEIAFDHLRWKPATHGNMKCDGIPVPIDTILNAVIQPLAQGLATLVSKIELPTGALVRKALDELRPAHTMKLDAKSEACLDLAPDALVLSPVGGAGSTMTLKLGVEVAPRVTLGACPAKQAAAAPSRVVAKNVPLADHFEVVAAVAVAYDDLAAKAAPALKGKRFGDADHGVFIDAIEIGDASGRLLVKLEVHGALDGDLYLWGTPVIVEEKGRHVLRVPDLQVAVETKSILQKIALGLWNAVGDGLAGVLKEKLVLDLTDKLEQARASMSGRKELSVGPVTTVLTTKLDKIKPGDVSSRAGALVVQPVLVGEAEVAFEGRGK